MMLSWLGNKKNDSEAIQAARDIELGVEKVFSQMKYVTPDLGGIATTEEMGMAICKTIQTL